jgi:hypothetical protein
MKPNHLPTRDFLAGVGAVAPTSSCDRRRLPDEAGAPAASAAPAGSVDYLVTVRGTNG